MVFVTAAVNIKGGNWSTAKLTFWESTGILETKGHLFVVLNCEESDLVPQIESMEEILAFISHLASLFYEPVLNSKGCIKLICN